MNSKETLIEINDLVQKYGDKEVLNIKKLSLARGKIYGIMGPSGAGKSTLLRILNLLEPPYAGEILYHGRNIYGLAPKERLRLQRKMAMVFQQPVLFNTSVRENVAYGLKIRKVDPARITSKVNTALKRVGLEHVAERKALNLSGGESQRVALARATVLDLEVLLLDEPTANLDPGNIAIIEQLINDLNQERNLTVIMVTHNIFQAQRIADEVVFVHGGRVIETGPAKRVFSSPAHDLTHQFIRGEMIY